MMKYSKYTLDGFQVSERGTRIELTLSSPILDRYGQIDPEEGQGLNFITFYEVADYDLHWKTGMKIVDIFQAPAPDSRTITESSEYNKNPISQNSEYKRWCIESDSGVVGFIVCKDHSGPI
jgi:hypothetical protein